MKIKNFPDIKRLSQRNKDRFSCEEACFCDIRLQKALRLVPNVVGKSLDIGCGTGAFSMQLASKGWETYGIETSFRQAELASKRSARTTIFEVGTGRIPFRDGSFDLIFAGELIEHLIDTREFIREIYRLLKNDGTFILTTPNLASLENRLRILLGLYPSWLEYELENGNAHIRIYTLGALKKQLAACGFIFRKCLGDIIPLIPKRFFDYQKRWLQIGGDLFPALSQVIIISAQKKR